MVGPQPAPTVAERRRFDALKELGCIACRLDGFRHIPAEIHHVVEGNRRLGHRYSLPLCPTHHRGVFESVFDKLKGPSLARSKRDFTAEYGTERELLARVDKLIGWEGRQCR